MTHERRKLMTGRGLLMAVDASISDLSGVSLLETNLLGIISMVDKDICRDLYRTLCEHRSGIVVICIDRLMLFDAVAAKVVLMLARRAMVNFNVLHMVVGTGAVRERALQIGFDHIASVHNSYDGFLARKSG